MQRSDARFGLTEQQWLEAKAELRQAILAAAWRRQMTDYGEVAASVSVVALDPHSGRMNHLLGEIFSDEHSAGRPVLTAIVTRRHGDKQPGDGFFEMARMLGYRFEDPLTFWARQVQEVFQLHGRPLRTRGAQPTSAPADHP